MLAALELDAAAKEQADIERQARIALGVKKAIKADKVHHKA